MSFTFSLPASNQRTWEENIDFERETAVCGEQADTREGVCVCVCVCVMEKDGMDKDKERQITEIVTESGSSLQSVQAQVQYESFTQNK